MSLRAILWVFEHSDATHGGRLVLLSLADHADDEGRDSWPAVKTIAKKARLTDRAARDALRRLERDGHIRQTGKSPYSTNIYEIIGIARGEESSAPPDADDVGGGKVTPSEGSSSSVELSLEQSVEEKQGAARPRNPIWDVLVEIFGPVPKRFAGHQGRVVSDLRALLVEDGIRDIDLAQDEIRRRRSALAGEWGVGKATKDALVKHWRLAGELADGGATQGLSPDAIFRQALDDEEADAA